MSRKIILGLIFLGVIVVLAAGYGYYEFERKVEGLESTKAAHVLTANELYDAFESDESAASLRYVDQVIEVTGEVVSAKVGDSQQVVVLHAENAMAGGINCSLSKTTPGIEKGMTLTIRGMCQGVLLDVILNNAHVVKKE